jgi:hypothetical protein
VKDPHNFNDRCLPKPLLLVSASLLLSACTGVLWNEAFREGSRSDGPVSMSLNLRSPILTRKSEASFELSCGTAMHYLVAEFEPKAESSNWKSCADGVIAVPLSSGWNELHFWFKSSGEGISPGPALFTVYSGESLDLLDPTPGAGDNFGQSTVELSNGNIAVSDPNDDTSATDAGAVHLFDGHTGRLVRSIYGEESDDHLGDGGFTALSNGNFVVQNVYDDENGVTNAGSIRLLSAESGDEIARYTGEAANAFLGAHPVTELENGTCVAISPREGHGGLSMVGMVLIFDCQTGHEINRVYGDQASDQLGVYGITVLPNGNFVVANRFDDNGATVNTGSVMLFDGDSGSLVHTIYGSAASEQIPWSSGIVALTSGNYLISAPGAVSGAGAVILVDGETGIEIGRTVGNSANDAVGYYTPKVLSNGNYVIPDPNDDIPGATDAGSAILVDGETGLEIARVSGDSAGDIIANSIDALSNGNFVIRGSASNQGAVTNAGVSILVNGTTGAEIARIYGQNTDDQLGYFAITELTNGNYFLNGGWIDSGALTNVGCGLLVNGLSGAEISRSCGDQSYDAIGIAGATALSGGRYLLSNPSDDDLTVVNAGSVWLMGSTGAEISRIKGQYAEDAYKLGPVLSNGNYVVQSDVADNGGQGDVGVAILVDGATGTEISRIYGDQDGDKLGTTSAQLRNGKLALYSLHHANGSNVDAGSMLFIDPSSGEEIFRVYGTEANAQLGGGATQELSSSHLLNSNPNSSRTGLSNAGQVRIIMTD